MNDLSRAAGGALGIAVIGSVLTAAYRSHLQLSGLPQQARCSVALAVRIGGSAALHARTAFIDGLHLGLTFAAGAAALAAILLALLLAPRRASQPRRRASSLIPHPDRCSTLDATVVLMVPVLLVLADRFRAPGRPLFLDVVVVANVAWIAVPQGNPTNLVLIDHLHISPLEFVAHVRASD